MNNKFVRKLFAFIIGISLLIPNISTVVYSQTEDSKVFLPLINPKNPTPTPMGDTFQNPTPTSADEQHRIEDPIGVLPSNPDPIDEPISVDDPIEVLPVPIHPVSTPAPPIVEKPPRELEERALALVRERTGIGADSLTIANTTSISYSLQNIAGFSFKITDTEGGIYGVTLDRGGKEMESAKLTANEVQAYLNRYGRLDRALAERLEQTDDGRGIDVQIWLQGADEKEYTGPQRPDPQNKISEEEIVSLYERVDAYLADKTAAVVEPIYEIIRQFDGEALTDGYMPVIHATLRPDVIREITRLEGIDRIYLSPVNEPTLDIARANVHANVVHDRGMTGLPSSPSRPNVAVIEVGGQINTANSFLPGVVQDFTSSCLHPHAAAVAGIVGSKHTIQRGIAPGTWLRVGGSCGGWSSQLQSRSTAAANAGVSVFNLSWGPLFPTGSLNGNDRYYDSLVLNRWRTVVPSAGNAGNSTGWIGNPGTAYNVITAGSSDDHDTIDWADDTIASYSSWKDPYSWHSDREKPEITAPGTDMKSTTNSSPWIGNVGSGTSYAAPVVAGLTALLMERAPILSVWPEINKAIIMATAIHNIEGTSRLSEKDGAGGVAADLADNVARRVTGLLGGDWGGQYYSCGSANSINLKTMHLTADAQTRAVVAWDTDPNYGAYDWQPGADLDIRIYGPNGYVTGSYSWDNTYEIVEFIPQVTGNYTLQVNKYRCDYNPRWLGWAMFQNETQGRELRVAHSNKCADVAYASTSYGGNVNQWPCHGGDNQRWVLGSIGSHYKLTALHSGMVLDVSGISTLDGANIYQWGWWKGNNQLWDFTPNGNHYQISSVNSGKCLDVAGISTADGANIHQWTCHGGNNQKWRLLQP